MSLDLDALKLAFCGGTPGEWSHGWNGQSIIVAGDTNGDADSDRHYGGKVVCESVSMLDQAAIIAARSAFPDLIAAIERLQAEVDLLMNERDDAYQFYDAWIKRAGDLQAENGRLVAELARVRLDLTKRLGSEYLAATEPS